MDNKWIYNSWPQTIFHNCPAKMVNDHACIITNQALNLNSNPAVALSYVALQQSFFVSFPALSSNCRWVLSMHYRASLQRYTVMSSPLFSTVLIISHVNHERTYRIRLLHIWMCNASVAISCLCSQVSTVYAGWLLFKFSCVTDLNTCMDLFWRPATVTLAARQDTKKVIYLVSPGHTV